MTTGRPHTMTPRGVAALLVRGIRASFAPEKQEAEIERLAEYLRDMVFAQTMHDSQDGPASRKQTERDAEWLNAIAHQIENA
jgi:hypothetical protein